jgi:hypothetical protein
MHVLFVIVPSRKALILTDLTCIVRIRRITVSDWYVVNFISFINLI